MAIAQAQGCWVTDVEGKRYLDCLAGALCYEAQRLIPMPEKTAMLYYCPRERFLNSYPLQQPQPA